MQLGNEQVEALVREHLQPGETFRAAVWASRADEHTAVTITRADVSPFRMRKRESGRPGARRGVNGVPTSRAVGLDEHIRLVTDPRVLALTDRRLLVLSQHRSWRDVFGSPSGAVRPLRLNWECPRDELASVTEEGGRLNLTFTDRSSVTLLTPTTQVKAFLAG